MQISWLARKVKTVTSGVPQIDRCNASVDAVFYAWMLRSYSRTNKYTLAIIGYVFGAGVLTTVASPNFGRLYKRQSENEGEISPWRVMLMDDPVLSLRWIPMCVDPDFPAHAQLW